jgi:hypothetical protein
MSRSTINNAYEEKKMQCDCCGNETETVHACERCGKEGCQDCVESKVWSPVIGLCADCNPGATNDRTINAST